MNTGTRIAKLRNSRGWSQPKLAELMNVSQSTVAMWESNKRNVSNDALIKLSQVFHVSTDYLLGNEESEHTPEWATETDMLDLDKVLQSSAPMGFQGMDMNEETKEKVRSFLIGLYWEQREELRNEGKK